MKYLSVVRVALLLLSVSAAQVFAQSQAPTTLEMLGYPKDARVLIIHADDLGMSHSVNRATFAALENHWITSASILVPCPWFPEVAQWSQSHQDADLGIHIAMNSEWTTFRWRPLSGSDKVSSLLDDKGYLPLLETDVAKKAKAEEAEIEARAQIDKARAAGIPLSHFDSHMGALFGRPDLFGAYRKMGDVYHTPVLIARVAETESVNAGENTPLSAAWIDQVVQIGTGVDKKDWTAWYEKQLAALKPGVYQMIVHLGYDDDEMRGATADHPDWGAAWRQADLDMVKSPEFQNFLKQQHFTLVGWKDLSKAAEAHSAR
jgi:predicted glycoside hydrolase/deacetylase ChbG (UPF0249 family)